MLFQNWAEAKTYLASDEAAYWAWLDGGSIKWRHEVRMPTDGEDWRWRVLPPDLPLDHELMRRAGRE